MEKEELEQQEVQKDSEPEVVEESKEQEDINSIFPGATPIEKPTKDSPAYDDVIEEARLAFSKTVKKNRIGSYIAMGVVLALAVGSVVCIGMAQMALKIVGWSLVGTAVVGMLVFYIVTRQIVPNATKQYIDVVNKQMNMWAGR